MGRLEAFGLKGPTAVDGRQVMSHVRAVVEADAAGHPAESYQAEGINVFFGHARFVDSHRIEVGGKQISSKKFVICTGSLTLGNFTVRPSPSGLLMHPVIRVTNRSPMISN